MARTSERQDACPPSVRARLGCLHEEQKLLNMSRDKKTSVRVRLCLSLRERELCTSTWESCGQRRKEDSSTKKQDPSRRKPANFRLECIRNPSAHGAVNAKKAGESPPCKKWYDILVLLLHVRSKTEKRKATHQALEGRQQRVSGEQRRRCFFRPRGLCVRGGTQIDRRMFFCRLGEEESVAVFHGVRKTFVRLSTQPSQLLN